jgi:hypothetical protein
MAEWSLWNLGEKSKKGEDENDTVVLQSKYFDSLKI